MRVYVLTSSTSPSFENIKQYHLRLPRRATSSNCHDRSQGLVSLRMWPMSRADNIDRAENVNVEIEQVSYPHLSPFQCYKANVSVLDEERTGRTGRTGRTSSSSNNGRLPSLSCPSPYSCCKLRYILRLPVSWKLIAARSMHKSNWTRMPHTPRRSGSGQRPR
jgi:hypothetical protein